MGVGNAFVDYNLNVSMKSGLEGRNNTSGRSGVSTLNQFRLNEVRPRRPEQSENVGP